MSELSLPLLTTESNEMATFPQFANLPLEIRDLIWEEALKKDRVLSMHVWTLGEDCWSAGRTMQLLHGRPLGKELSDVINSATTPRLTDRREAEVNSGSKKEYGVFVDDKAAISKLFLVNTESRQAAKRFYRVQIPCTYMKPGLYKKGTLYLHPESDTIQMGLTEGFGRFAHCVWAMDRRHVGLVNLAPDLKVRFSGFNGLDWRRDSFPDDAAEGELWKEGLGRLKNVSFQDTIPGCLDPRWADLRLLPGLLGPIGLDLDVFEERWAKPNTPQYLPIEGMRLSALFWFYLLHKKEITLSPDVNYRCMFSSRDTLHQCLPNRAKKWQCAADLFIQDLRAKGTEVVPGYWSFPMDYLALVKNDEGYLQINRNNQMLEEMRFDFELCIGQLTAYTEHTGIVDCRKRHLWKTS
ncbi:hypothetical protein FPHYL_8117 [Fusarium phyllophilum]|uniref:2EXR domain-containing protein n=1 Tax=Fusarium phyllophilum TaxID=47803 RepID=A0A8H5JI49_9HYPO|nr:hypothetical protein FPHYL_8117 [Fusarium phyllophilum]